MFVGEKVDVSVGGNCVEVVVGGGEGVGENVWVAVSGERDDVPVGVDEVDMWQETNNRLNRNRLQTRTILDLMATSVG
jgi:hypothetical protein